MEDQQIENQPKQRLSQISQEEVDIINDIRELNFGRINITIQDGVIVTKEITKITRNGKGRNRNNGRQRNIVENGGCGNNENRINNDIDANNSRLY
ncbi:MAG: DUF2292 domain-containing protein [Patescibacteria group bacterium]|nr:DUF2292 domain-containing protein [Patescibacteria group bacterium]